MKVTLGASISYELNDSVTHAIVQHERQDSVKAIKSMSTNAPALVSVEWFYAAAVAFQKEASQTSNSVFSLPSPSDHPLFPAPCIPGFSARCPEISVSGFLDLDRLIILYTLEALGTKGVVAVNINQTSHVVVMDLKKPSEKLNAIRSRELSISIVSHQWVYECIRTWSSVEEGPYKEPTHRSTADVNQTTDSNLNGLQGTSVGDQRENSVECQREESRRSLASLGSQFQAGLSNLIDQVCPSNSNKQLEQERPAQIPLLPSLNSPLPPAEDQAAVAEEEEEEEEEYQDDTQPPEEAAAIQSNQIPNEEKEGAVEEEEFKVDDTQPLPDVPLDDEPLPDALPDEPSAARIEDQTAASLLSAIEPPPSLLPCQPLPQTEPLPLPLPPPPPSVNQAIPPLPTSPVPERSPVIASHAYGSETQSMVGILLGLQNQRTKEDEATTKTLMSFRAKPPSSRNSIVAASAVAASSRGGSLGLMGPPPLPLNPAAAGEGSLGDHRVRATRGRATNRPIMSETAVEEDWEEVQKHEDDLKARTRSRSARHPTEKVPGQKKGEETKIKKGKKGTLSLGKLQADPQQPPPPPLLPSVPPPIPPPSPPPPPAAITEPVAPAVKRSKRGQETQPKPSVPLEQESVSLKASKPEKKKRAREPPVPPVTSSLSATALQPRIRQRHIFMMSGISEGKEYESIKRVILIDLRDERARLSEGDGWKDAKMWRDIKPVILLPKLVRKDKIICAMAAGCFIVDASTYITASVKEKRFVDLESHELTSCESSGSKKNETSEGPSISPGATTHWRLRGGRAFLGLVVILPGKLPSPLDSDTLKLMIEAGGGRVVTSFPTGKDTAIVTIADPEKIKPAEIPENHVFASPQYIIDWVAHPQSDLSKHYIYGSKQEEAASSSAGRRKSSGKQSKSVLSKLEDQRGVKINGLEPPEEDGSKKGRKRAKVVHEEESESEIF